MTTTVVFGVYAITFLAALLTAGRLSDHIGRRPVLLAGIAGNILALAVFVDALSVAALLAARVIQGLATGGAISAVGAGTLDINQTRGAVANAAAPGAGTASGAVLSAIAVRWLPEPTQLIYLVLAGVLIVQAVGVVRLPETSPRAPNAWRSLVRRSPSPPRPGDHCSQPPPSFSQFGPSRVSTAKNIACASDALPDDSAARFNGITDEGAAMAIINQNNLEGQRALVTGATSSSLSAASTQPSFLSTPKGGSTLAFLCAIGFLDFVGASIVNVAFPSIRRDLGFSVQSLQWVLSGYLITYGGFMLLGGRAADLLGRRRILVAGIVVFAATSLVGAVVVVVGQAFSSGVTGWLTFGVSLGVLTLAGVAQLDRVVAVITGATAGIGPGRSRPDRRSS